MRILVLAGTFPPHVIGGAELSAFNLTRQLVKKGHHVSVLTMAEPDEPELWGEKTEYGYHLYRLRFPRPYTLYGHAGATRLKKIIWHLKDYLDPANKRLLRKVLEHAKPDHINAHIIPGLGFNMLGELARHRSVSVLCILHDLNLACLKTTMFAKNRDCEKQCAVCKGTSVVKNHYLSGINMLGFVSPSQANLDKVRRFVPQVAGRPGRVIRNVPDETPPLPKREKSKHIRLLYAGRLHATKGVGFLLDVLAPLAEKYAFELTLLGRGPEEEELRQRYGQQPWLKFGGFVGQQEVTRHVAGADLLCVPSLWAEPYGRVTAEALMLGTPVIGSNRGGTAELVRHGETGLLVGAGDTGAWRNAFVQVFENPEILDAWRNKALSYAEEFSPEKIVTAYEAFISQIRGEKRA